MLLTNPVIDDRSMVDFFPNSRIVNLDFTKKLEGEKKTSYKKRTCPQYRGSFVDFVDYVLTNAINFSQSIELHPEEFDHGEPGFIDKLFGFSKIRKNFINSNLWYSFSELSFLTLKNVYINSSNLKNLLLYNANFIADQCPMLTSISLARCNVSVTDFNIFPKLNTLTIEAGLSPVTGISNTTTSLVVTSTPVPILPDSTWFNKQYFLFYLLDTNSSGTLDSFDQISSKSSIKIEGQQKDIKVQLKDSHCLLKTFVIPSTLWDNTTSIPSCFYCYWSDLYQNLPANIPPRPLNYNCNISIDQYKYTIPIAGFFVDIYGNNLGYGKSTRPSNMVLGNPNTMLKYPAYTQFGTDTISFSTEYNYTFDIFWAVPVKMDYIHTVNLESGDLLVKSYGLFNTILPMNITVGGLDCQVVYNSSSQLNCIIPKYSTSSPLPIYATDSITNVTKYSAPYFKIDSFDFKDILTINANFGLNPYNVSVLLSDLNCNITTLTDSTLQCIPHKNVTNSRYYNLLVYANAYDTSLIIPGKDDCGTGSTCNAHGSCINGVCRCDNGFSGYYCQSQLNPGVVILPNNTDPSPTIIVRDGLNFTFNIIAIQEIDELSSVVRELKTNKWLQSTTGNETSSITTYSLQTSTAGVDQINATIEYSKNSRLIEFAGQSTLYPENSLKLLISINNWSFKDRLNQLRILMESKATVDLGCSELNIDINNGSNVSYLTMMIDEVTFYGRFLPYALADNKPILIQNQVVNQTKESVVVGMTLPYCDSCVIDPDFSVLINPDKTASKCSSKKFESWKIATIVVVCSVVILASAITSAIVLRKKIRYSREEKKMETRMSSIK
ncbi:hypothetical protein PPL_05337 [Heterostelium album PN500]|uniref:EGF-like domain-containing protein n=1 Tax=Heterostelium pallidum (strain ATCC 26659 / Pp 5 / PN500) TaxID=670386 RepID=D3B9W7_HETP5|nr:hypothetical protein PPL_05337 [Heterostelium album PN500]EFA81354.1 hypothetical protein PPL_05337 [Heterostelium album PN500]|eukprot:XP_020433472.1 hypothetical protein PPL_05337 [Heterostelium album PN500]